MHAAMPTPKTESRALGLDTHSLVADVIASRLSRRLPHVHHGQSFLMPAQNLVRRKRWSRRGLAHRWPSCGSDPSWSAPTGRESPPALSAGERADGPTIRPCSAPVTTGGTAGDTPQRLTSCTASLRVNPGLAGRSIDAAPVKPGPGSSRFPRSRQYVLQEVQSENGYEEGSFRGR